MKRPSLAPLAFVLIAFGLAACSGGGKRSETARTPSAGAKSPQADQSGPARYKIGNPYTVAGKRYYPKERFDFLETGRASWYGPNFHGRKTANGETYDQRALTAAHPTLQLPSIIRVTNVGNGKSVVLRVNDRGPYHGDRVLDVSEAGAEALQFKRYGTALVRIEVMSGPSREAARLARSGASVATLEGVRASAADPAEDVVIATAAPPRSRPSRPPARSPAPSPRRVELASIGAEVNVDQAGGVVDGLAYVQAGAFSKIDNARKLAARLKRIGPSRIQPSYVNDRRIYRVQLGPYDTVTSAELALERATAAGVDGAHLVVTQ